MIILGFIIDYLVSLALPFNTYFIINEVDKNKIDRVIMVGGILDIIYNRIGNIIILLSIYLVFRLLKIKKKYYYIKNILLYIVFFNIEYFFLGYGNKYIYLFSIGSILQVLYMILYMRYFKKDL